MSMKDNIFTGCMLLCNVPSLAEARLQSRCVRTRACNHPSPKCKPSHFNSYLFLVASSCSQVMTNSLLAPASVHSLETIPGNACRFLSLPHELVIEILKYLPVPQILQIETVSFATI